MVERVWTLVVSMLLGMGVPLMAIEEPAYRVVEEFPEFEVREYAGYIVAETRIEGPFSEASNVAFRILADFIFGNNTTRTKMAMTAPVSQQAAASERIAMTAPVTQSGNEAGKSFTVAFVMPSKYSMETLPRPVDPRVTIRQVGPHTIAVRRYSGNWSAARYDREKARLLAAVAVAGYTSVGEATWARYNSPFSLPMLRRNEIQIKLEQLPSSTLQQKGQQP